MATKEKLLPLVSPGEILSEEFLKPLALTEYKLAQALKVPRVRINGIVRGTRAITPDTALRLALYFGTTPQFWLNLQNDYDLRSLQRVPKALQIDRCPLFLSSGKVVGLGAGGHLKVVAPNPRDFVKAGGHGKTRTRPKAYPV